MTLSITALLLALCLVAPGLVLLFSNKEGAISFPRERIIGSLLTLASFYWAGSQGYILLREDFTTIAKFIPYVLPVIAIASCFLMDYLFTRGLGFMICLLGTHYLNLLFAANPGARQLGSLAAYVGIIAGMFLIGHPWMLRKGIEICREQDKWKKILPATFAITAILVLVIPFNQ